MKFMKLGSKPDTFYTEDTIKTLISDAPSDLIIQINKCNYLLHKSILLPNCGLLRRLYSDFGNSSNTTLQIHDIPGGEYAFDMCAKFCYGITISLGAHNFVPAFCAAKFLRMTESVDRINFVLKLEAFFTSCILEGWKDSITALETTAKMPNWSEIQGIFRKCINSIVEKILTPQSKVTWSYTYTRPGYEKKLHQSVPKDWWTEDISDLDIDNFRCIITAVRSTNLFPPQLIGEALHVYAFRWLPNGKTKTGSTSRNEECSDKNQRILENVVGMIPDEPGSVSVRFLLWLLSIANYIGASTVTKAEILRRSGRQFDEASVHDLMFSSHYTLNRHFYDIDSVGAVLESFLIQWKCEKSSAETNQTALRKFKRVGKLIDSYIQVVAKDVHMPVTKIVSLVEALPENARTNHDDLYEGINTYLKEHPDVTKSEKKRLCRVLDCQKMSPEVCAHVVNNECLPLRTVVQVLFFEQERGSRPTEQLDTCQHPGGSVKNGRIESRACSEEASSMADGGKISRTHSNHHHHHHKTSAGAEKLQLRLERSMSKRKVGPKP